MLKDFGEFAFIKRFSPQFLQNLPQGVTGIGDDCAVIPYDKKHSLLLTVDTLVDSVHFIGSKIKAADLGHKSLAVNLSDIAAMGGEPDYALLALSVPPDREISWLDDFFRGFKECCSEYGVMLVGGDMTKTPDKLAISVTVTGKSITQNIKYRSSARIGDVICVTGVIGDSVGGLQCYLNDLPASKEVDALKEAHFRPRPHLKEGLWLSNFESVHSMIDISDGIESDIRRIMESSGWGAEIELTALPLSQAFKKVSKQQNWNAYDLAATGGEDYCLLLTVAPDDFENISRSFYDEFSSPLTVIGKIVPRERELTFFFDHKRIVLTEAGFDHFRN